MKLGIIPARGGSKGIPKKNIREICGKPLIAYTIQAAQNATLLDDCIISTDNEEIAAVARDHGGNVPFMRPGEHATDTASSVGVVQHAVESYEAANDVRVSAIVLLQPTNPFRTGEDIDESIKMFDANPDAKSLISGYSVIEHHPYIMYKRDGDYATPAYKEGRNVRRQDFPPIYLRNGVIYIAKRDLVMDENTIYDDEPLFYEMPQKRSLNIDEPMDLKIAELMMQDK